MKHHKSSIYITSIILFIVCGYVFFFCSNMILPKGTSNYLFTELGKENTYENRTFTISRWDYCKTDNVMEVELDIKNNNYDGVDKYHYSAKTRPASAKTPLIDIVIEDNNFVVLQIKNIPEKWQEISLSIALKEEHGETLSLYSNIEDVAIKKNIVKKTKTQYLIDRLQRNIADYEKQIIQHDNEIQKYNKQIEDISQQIATLEENKSFQTDKEISETNRQIQNYTTTKSSIESKISSAASEIEELNRKTLKAAEQIQHLKKEDSTNG